MNLQQRQQQWKQLSQANRFQDPLDFSVRFIMIRGPTVYILINMTLVIWLVQTMLSSNLQQLPRSLFYFAPMLIVQPISDIKTVSFRQNHFKHQNIVYNNKSYNSNKRLHSLINHKKIKSQIQFQNTFLNNHHNNYNHNQEVTNCPENYEKISLKIFPTITDSHIVRKNLTFWGQSQNQNKRFQFCVKRMIQKSTNLSKSQCQNGIKESNSITQISPLMSSNQEIIQNKTKMIYCNGYCVSNKIDCPITSIRKVYFTDQQKFDFAVQNSYLPQQNQSQQQIDSKKQTIFYSTSSSPSQNFKEKTLYVYSRQPTKGRSIIQLSSAYQSLCANDFKYFDQFKTVDEYWEDVSNCKKQGRLDNGILNIFDIMETKQFFKINNIQNPQQLLTVQNQQNQQKVSQKISLGFIRQIIFDKNIPGCQQAESLLKGGNKNNHKLSLNTISPTFVQTILVSCFIFFIACWLWLIGYYCFDGHIKQKNAIAALLAIIQLIVISYIYYTNKEIFGAGVNWNKISECINQQIKAADQWNFGVQSQRPFLGIIFLCVVFLSINFIAFLIDKLMYVSQ